ncbi:MAG: YciK family oxidoreductase [Gammaproteobacteria bacterium]|nr:YciK family oxidoreductase [Gammaproteobacteria bacterium]MDX2459206.1 YciK family oxidoreductase [Gammaproteobacteria bacterium]
MNTDKIPNSYVAPTDLLAERVILVTGAGDGIGKAVSLACAAHGATVILLGRTVHKLESVYDDIVTAGGPKPAIYPMDLEGAVPEDHWQLAQQVDAELGRLDGLLHNAGLLGTLTPLEHYDTLEWLRVMQVNVNAPFLLSQACLPLLKRAPDASLLFTSSGVGRRGRAYWGAYSASKFAVEGMMQVLADELDENTRVRVNSINPGQVRTRMRAAAYPAENPDDLLTPQDIVHAYLYLLGPDSHGVHGKSLDAQ